MQAVVDRLHTELGGNEWFSAFFHILLNILQSKIKIFLLKIQ